MRNEEIVSMDFECDVPIFRGLIGKNDVIAYAFFDDELL
jgi:hypothetical protein